MVIGEGGSGGAIAIATGNRVYMLEHAIYSVISPEGAASILWRDSTRAKEAATNMKITAQDLLELGIIDGIIPEPLGGAHRDPETVIAATGDLIAKSAERAWRPLRRAASRGAPREIPGDGPQSLTTAPDSGVGGGAFAHPPRPLRQILATLMLIQEHGRRVLGGNLACTV